MFLVACTAAIQEPTFNITDTKRYVPIVTLLTQENIKPLKQLESDFKWTINWNKYHSKRTEHLQNRYLDFLIDQSFQEVNRHFVLSFENRRVRESYKQCFLPNVEIKDYNATIDGKNFFDQPVKKHLWTYDNI